MGEKFFYVVADKIIISIREGRNVLFLLFIHWFKYFSFLKGKKNVI
jgi:hypothetical protein